MIVEPVTGVEVLTEFRPLAFIYGLCPVFAVINGVEVPSTWGAQFFPLTPGQYSIGAFTNYMFFSRCGLNSIPVELYAGQVVRVTWTAPAFTFMKGPIQAQLIASAYGPPPPGAYFSTPSPPQPAPVCPACGAPDVGATFCTRCQHRLRA